MPLVPLRAGCIAATSATRNWLASSTEFFIACPKMRCGRQCAVSAGIDDATTRAAGRGVENRRAAYRREIDLPLGWNLSVEPKHRLGPHLDFDRIAVGSNAIDRRLTGAHSGEFHRAAADVATRARCRCGARSENIVAARRSGNAAKRRQQFTGKSAGHCTKRPRNSRPAVVNVSIDIGPTATEPPAAGELEQSECRRPAAAETATGEVI